MLSQASTCTESQLFCKLAIMGHWSFRILKAVYTTVMFMYHCFKCHMLLCSLFACFISSLAELSHLSLKKHLDPFLCSTALKIFLNPNFVTSNLAWSMTAGYTYQTRRGYHRPFSLKSPFHLPSDHARLYGLWITATLSCSAVLCGLLSRIVCFFTRSYRDVMYRPATRTPVANWQSCHACS